MKSTALQHWSFVLLMSLSFSSFSQDPLLHDLLGEPLPNCDSIETATLQQITSLSFFEEEDSIKTLLDQWEQQCGYNEAIHRVFLLYKIRDHSLSTKEVHPWYRDMNDIYLQKLEEFSYSRSEIHPDYREWYRAGQEFMGWTQGAADSLQRRSENTALEGFFLALYTAHSYNQLKHQWYSDETFDGLPLAEAYREEIFESETSGGRPILFAGAWMPLGPLRNYIGESFMIGLSGRQMFGKRAGAELGGTIRFPHTKQMFSVADIDSVAEAKHTFGLSLHALGTFKLFPGHFFDFNVLGGAGLDLFTTDAVKGFNEHGDRIYVNFMSYDLMAGLEMSLPVMNFDRAGIRALHH